MDKAKKIEAAKKVVSLLAEARALCPEIGGPMADTLDNALGALGEIAELIRAVYADDAEAGAPLLKKLLLSLISSGRPRARDFIKPAGL